MKTCDSCHEASEDLVEVLVGVGQKERWDSFCANNYAFSCSVCETRFAGGAGYVISYTPTGRDMLAGPKETPVCVNCVVEWACDQKIAANAEALEITA